jgi:hypothetical protein
MKQGMLLFGLAGLLFFTNGCKKDSLSSIQGVWELRQAKGMVLVNYPPGNGKKIKFDGNHYERSDNGQITQSGTFVIVTDGSVSESTCLKIDAGRYRKRIIYDNSTPNVKIFLEIEGNKLNFISGCFAYDAGSETEYARQ